MAIRALYLDFGNVFSTFQIELFYRALIKEGYTNLPGHTLHRLQNEVYAPFDRGEIGAEEYYHKFCERSGILIAQEKFEKLYSDIFFEDIAGLDTLLGRVRSDIATYLLSNTNPIHYERYFRNHPFLWKHIPEERQILSYRVKASKPDPQIYQHALNRAGVEPKEALFVDDMEINIESWKKLGGHGIIYHGFHHDISSLEESFREYGILREE